jgi:hypothetical protein
LGGEAKVVTGKIVVVMRLAEFCADLYASCVKDDAKNASKKSGKSGRIRSSLGVSRWVLQMTLLHSSFNNFSTFFPSRGFFF